MLNIVLVEPEIPQNTGNIARTCAVTGCKLHLIEPLGFSVSDAAVKRAGLDYWHAVDVAVYPDIDRFFTDNPDAPENIWLFTTKAVTLYTEAVYTPDCFLMFGKETAGLSKNLREQFSDRCVRIPMRDIPAARSLNLGNSAAIAAYEAIRQLGKLQELR
ncbi:MAG: tRNA (cytidine(34)-2'-O)-methyltransferase [Oscillospiraceae bacterium]|jgi:tRNA (cytidine/uridine-2'-O-)-methyltransferase|nr:tRNA (cytidine(34)-2'-O)-methyltransferase [Oscillospiraceae bacterium]